MSARARGIAIAILLVAIPARLCAQGEASRAVLPGAADSVARRVVRGLTDAGFAVIRTEPGLVATDELVVGDTRYKDEGFGYWVDCGRQGFISRAAGARELRLRITALLTPVGADSTAVELRLQAAAVGDFDGPSQRVSCTSRSRLEPLLLSGIGEF